MENVSLLTKTRSLLDKSSDSLNKIAQKSEISYEWLKKFKTEDWRDPGVKRVQKLHDYLVKAAAENDPAVAT